MKLSIFCYKNRKGDFIADMAASFLQLNPCKEADEFAKLLQTELDVGSQFR